MTDTRHAHRHVEELHADGVVWSLDFPATPDHPSWHWRHYDLVNARARAEIDADHSWPEDSRRILLGTDESPRIIPDGDMVFGVLPSYARTGLSDEFDITHWHFAACRNRVVTARRRAARSLAAIHHQATSGHIPAGPGALIDACLGDFARSARTRLITLADQLDATEDALLRHHRSEPLSVLAGQIGQARREAVVLKRAVSPIARMLDDLEEEAPSWMLTDEHTVTRNAVLGVLDDIAALNDRARSLQDELASRQTDETNRRLYIVSLVTVLLMPATFVTGFFGMNTGGLPWAGEHVMYGTFYAGIGCVVAVLLTLALLKWRRLM